MDFGKDIVPSYDIKTLRMAISKEPDINRCLDWLCSYTTGKYAVYHLARHRGPNADSPYVRTNYPARWVQRYLLHNYIDIDPVVARGFNSAFSFFWDEIELSSNRELRFLEDAANHGIGISGLSIPVCDKQNRRALISISSDLPVEEWRELIADSIPSLVVCANFIHQKVIAEEFRDAEDKPSLSPRETECLSWIASGKDSTTVSIILGLSEHTVRDYLKSARFKLGCATLPQAVRQAVEYDLLINLAGQSPHMGGSI